MDPKACYQRWFQAMLARDHEEAREAARDLREWLRGGGFEPDWTPAQRAEFFKKTVGEAYADACDAADERFAPMVAALVRAGVPLSSMEVQQTGGMIFCLMISYVDARGRACEAVFGENGFDGFAYGVNDGSEDQEMHEHDPSFDGTVDDSLARLASWTVGEFAKLGIVPTSRPR